MKKIMEIFLRFKLCGVALICIILLIWASPNSFAKSYSESDLMQTEEFNELFDEVPDEVREILEENGIDKIDYDSIFNISPKKLWETLKELATGQTQPPLKSLVRLLSVIIILAVCGCFVTDDDKMKTVTQTAGALLCVISIISPLADAVSSAVAAITLSEKFNLALIPALAAVVSISGNPTLALSFQSVAFAAAQIIAAASKNYLVPVVGTVLSLDITGCVMPSFKLGSLTGIIKKTIVAILSFVATVFVSFLGIKGGLANAADTVASRGIKLAISSIVPVVGGALSEVFSGVVGSLVLVKSALGIFGIIVITLINLPFCIQLVFWIFSLRFAAAVGEMLNQDGVAELLKAVASTITLLNVVLVFNAVLFIIAIALILMIKAG